MQGMKKRIKGKEQKQIKTCLSRSIALMSKMSQFHRIIRIYQVHELKDQRIDHANIWLYCFMIPFPDSSLKSIQILQNLNDHKEVKQHTKKGEESIPESCVAVEFNSKRHEEKRGRREHSLTQSETKAGSGTNRTR